VSSVLASVRVSASTEGNSGAFVQGGCCWAHRAHLFGSTFLCIAALAHEHTATAS
jgi:hypothetical protein